MPEPDRAEQFLLEESGPLRFLLAVPPHPDSAGGRPLLCFLHGYDEAAPLEIRRALTLHGPLRRGNPQAALQDFVVVAPQLPVAGDLWRGFSAEVEQVVRAVQAAYDVDPRRSYLTGFSFGANGVFDLALRQSDLWTALWAVDPTRVPEGEPRQPLWLSSGQVSRRGRAAFLARLRLEPLGERPPGRRVYEDRGLDHVGTAAAAYADERIYEWLLGWPAPDGSADPA